MSKLTLSLLLLALSIEAGAAARLLNYESRVVRAAEQIERIKTDTDYAEEGVDYIRRLLPRTEQVEVGTRVIAVDNTWLYVLLDSYEAEKDGQLRLAKLNEAGGRLRALDEHLRRAEAASSESGNPRDQIREILSRPAFQPEPESAIGTFIKGVMRRVTGYVAKVYSALQQLVEKLLGAGAGSGWVSNVILVVALGVAVFLVVRLLRSTRLPRAKRKKTRIVLGEEIAADGTSSELAEAGLAAARAGDFRTAVRKLYVSLLYELGERGLIELEDSATNHEYLRRVSRFSALTPAMRYLTDRFDYVWYGMFPSSEEEFSAYLSRYQEAMERARTLAESPSA